MSEDIYTCKICNKQFKSARALQGHSRMHGPSNGKIFNLSCCCLLTKKEMLVRDLEKYQQRLIDCKNPICDNLFNPIAGRKHYCNNSCSAVHQNQIRKEKKWSLSSKSRKKISNTLKSHYEQNPRPYIIKQVDKSTIESKTNATTKTSKRIRKNLIAGPYTKLYHCTCSHCGKKELKRRNVKYCDRCSYLYKSNNRNKYRFTFNVYHYPNLFDLNELQEKGWFSPGGKAGKWNPQGLSRDHKVSVNEAIKNCYDPYYITHPLNCELLSHTINNKKNTESSIKYDILIKLINDYDKKIMDN